jgi:hypothetical protein
VKYSGKCSSEVYCVSVLVKNLYECSSEALCASVLVKYFVLVLCTSGQCCGDWDIMSIIYMIFHILNYQKINKYMVTVENITV